MHDMTIAINIQLQSFGNYLRDIWIVALVFVLIQNQTTISFPLLWIGLQLIVAIVTLFAFGKTGPNKVVPFIIPSVVLLFLFLFESPFWLYGLAVGISIWRVQERFNKLQNEQTTENSFSLLFFITFIAVQYISVIFYDGYSIILYTVFITGLVLLLSIRLFTVSMNSDKHNAFTSPQIAGFYFVGMISMAGLSVLIYLIAPFIRKVIEILFATIVSVLVIPFGPLMEKLVDLMKRSQINQEEENSPMPIGEKGEIEPDEINFEDSLLHFPIEWIFYGLATIAIIFIIGLLLKNKPERLELELNNIEYENEQIGEEKVNQKTQFNSLYKMETSILREKYAQFELEARSFNLGRSKNETVREWFKRMDWPVDAVFFQVYEELRYGGQLISSEKAELFLKKLEEIKINNFLKKDV